MKKYVLLTTVLFTLVVFSASAQSKNELKGPKAKNFKVWESSQEAAPVYFKTGAVAKGPQAKNLRPADRKSGALAVADTQGTVEKLQGPAAKNNKVWEAPSMIAAN